MNTSVGIILGIIIFLMIIAFTALILIVALRKPKSSSTSSTSSTTDSTVPITNISKSPWSEINRGFPVTNFPPCCDSSNEIKKIFSIIKGYNLEKKYMELFDVYSMLMCQDVQIRMKVCSDSFINDRLADLNTYGADSNNETAVSIVKSVVDLNNNKIGKLLIMATDLIEKHMNNIKNDNSISKTDKEQIFGYNSQFYRQKYEFMAKRCP